jgi:hypothetical protein
MNLWQFNHRYDDIWSIWKVNLFNQEKFDCGNVNMSEPYMSASFRSWFADHATPGDWITINNTVAYTCLYPNCELN